MNQAERHKDKSTAEIQRSLRYLKIKATRSIRDPKFVLEVCGFIVLTIYAAFTILMYFANRDSANAAQSAANTASQQLIASKQQFLDEHRPILCLTNDSGHPQYFPPPTTQIAWEVHVRNYGTAPANDVVFGTPP